MMRDEELEVERLIAEEQDPRLKKWLQTTLYEFREGMIPTLEGLEVLRRIPETINEARNPQLHDDVEPSSTRIQILVLVLAFVALCTYIIWKGN